VRLRIASFGETMGSVLRDGVGNHTALYKKSIGGVDLPGRDFVGDIHRVERRRLSSQPKIGA
jgi:hypothetical protein